MAENQLYPSRISITQTLIPEICNIKNVLLISPMHGARPPSRLLRWEKHRPWAHHDDSNLQQPFIFRTTHFVAALLTLHRILRSTPQLPCFLLRLRKTQRTLVVIAYTVVYFFPIRDAPLNTVAFSHECCKEPSSIDPAPLLLFVTGSTLYMSFCSTYSS